MKGYEEKYLKEVVPHLISKFGYKNIHEVPCIKKVVINTSVKEGAHDPKIFDGVMADLAAITGQKPVLRRARKAIANFKLRAGMPIGCMVTLRRKMMYEFINRFVNIALPRVRDFKGLSPRGFDGHGNYTLGLTEQMIFPEVNYDKVEKIFGMNITFVTTAKTDEEAMELLKGMGLPFRK